MTRFPEIRAFAAATLLLLATNAMEARAQTCRGMPRGGGLAAGVGSEHRGSTYGATLSKGVVGVGITTLSGNDRVSSWDANLRFTIAMGGKLQWCPSLGFEYRNDNMSVSDGSELTARVGTAAAGLSFGYEQEVSNGVSLIPFVGFDYQFTAFMFSLDAPDGTEGELSGDTLTRASVTYGALVRYRNFYGGFSGDRFLESDVDRPYRTRWMLGFAFGGSTPTARVARTPAARQRGQR